MNEIVEAVLKHKYKNINMMKQIYIFKRTKKNRIKDKVFNKLFYTFISETKVSILGEVVIMNGDYYCQFKSLMKETNMV